MIADKRLVIDEETLQELKLYCAKRKIYPLYKGVKEILKKEANNSVCPK